MDVSLTLKTAPAAEPVTTGAAKNYLKVPAEVVQDDDLIGRCIKTAREDMEKEYNVAIIDQTWTQKMSCFPYSRCFELKRRPLKTVTHVKYFDEANTLQTLNAADYLVQTAPVFGLIELKEDKSWPTTYRRQDAVEIEFVAGYGSADAAPARLWQELLLRLSEKYENRGEMIPENFKRHPAIGTWTDREYHV